MNAHARQYRFPVLSLVLVFAVTVQPIARADDAGTELARGADIFRANCATCHGVDGGPDPDSALVQSLGVVPANFADALFNSREPLSDWKIVVTDGGPALGFSDKMPAFGESLSESDIDAVLEFIKTLGGEHDYPDGSLNLFLPIRTKKAFPEDEWVWKQRYSGLEGDNVWKNTLEYEFRLGERWQGVLEVNHATAGGESGFGHFEPGFKYVLKHDRSNGFIATLGGNLGVPLASEADWELLPYLAFGKVLGDQWTLQSSARVKLNLDDSHGNVAEFAGIVHWVHTQRPRSVFPALEAIAEVPFHRGSGQYRKDTVQWSLIPQARIGLSKRGHVALNAGVELPVNDTWRYDWRAYVYLIWDFADGGFFDGW